MYHRGTFFSSLYHRGTLFSSLCWMPLSHPSILPASNSLRHHLTLLVSIINEEEGLHPILSTELRIPIENLGGRICLRPIPLFTFLSANHWSGRFLALGIQEGHKKSNPQIYKSLFVITVKFYFLRISTFFFPGGSIKAVRETFGDIPFV